jgi:hypothetical protein
MEKIKELERKYPNSTGIKFIKYKKDGRMMDEENYFLSEIYQTARNWERYMNENYKIGKRYVNFIEAEVVIDDVKEALGIIFSFRWLVKILKRIKHFLIYILAGKNVNIKKRKEEWMQWKQLQSSWTPARQT